MRESWHEQPQHLTDEEYGYLQSDFMRLFSSDLGKDVLTRILADLCFFKRCDTEEQSILNNYAKQLLSYLGEWDVGQERLIVDKIVRRKDAT